MHRRGRTTLGVGAAGLVLAGLLSSCAGASTSSTPVNPTAAEANPAGDIPDNQVYVGYQPADKSFSVKIPEGWGRSTQGTSVSFTDKLNTVAVDVVPAPSAPTVDSAKSTEIPQIESAGTNVSDLKVDTVDRPAGSAVLITYLTDAPKDPVTGKVVRDAVERYEFWKSETEVILTLSGPRGADNIDPWKIVTESFQWQQ